MPNDATQICTRSISNNHGDVGLQLVEDNALISSDDEDNTSQSSSSSSVGSEEEAVSEEEINSRSSRI